MPPSPRQGRGSGRGARKAVLLKPYPALVAVALVWGFSFLLIKIGLRDMSPTVLILIRAASGFAALAVYMLITRRPLLGKDWKRRIIPYTVLAVGSGVIP